MRPRSDSKPGPAPGTHADAGVVPLAQDELRGNVARAVADSVREASGISRRATITPASERAVHPRRRGLLPGTRPTSPPPGDAERPHALSTRSVPRWPALFRTAPA